VRRSRKLTLAGVGVGCLALFGGCGAVLGATSDAKPAPTVTTTVAAAPLPTVTRTAPAPGPVVVTAPPVTSTAPPPEPIALPAPTVYVDAPAPPPVQLAAAPAPAVSAEAPAPVSGSGTDPRFKTCKAAIAAGYGPYQQGVDPEYDWYRDADHDGVDCER